VILEGKKNPILEPLICEALRIVPSFGLNAVQSLMNGITDRILEKGWGSAFNLVRDVVLHDWSKEMVDMNCLFHS